MTQEIYRTIYDPRDFVYITTYDPEIYITTYDPRQNHTRPK